MKKDLQKIVTEIYRQKRVAILVICMVAYIILICCIKAEAEAREATDLSEVITKSVVASELTTEEIIEEPTTEDTVSAMANYYEALYGPKFDNKVHVNGYEFDYIPGAPYSVYESMADAIENKSETVEVLNETRYSENTVEIETSTIATTTEEEMPIEPESPVEDFTAEFTEAAYTPGELRYHGVLYWNDSKWTWYSEKVLPGGGLNIPGRYTDEDGFVCDENGYICLAADPSYIAPGTVIDTPFGRPGKLYDTGCAYGTVDVYVGW